MGYTRKFQRSHENNEELKVKERPLYQRVIAAVTAAGFVLQPLTAFANTIIRDNNVQLTATNNVTQVYAEKIVGDAAVNFFKDFKVEANNIVNMYFHTQNDTSIVKDNLVNFVNSKINIDGTVNAVRNSKIGGNLYFLSKDGMAVGKSGVINAGSLYVATPTNDAFNDFKGYAQADQEQQFSALMSGWGAIPVNSSGTISVLGKINTFDGINMRAGKSVLLGKNASGNSATKNTAASLRSDVIDFAGLVNIAGVDSGLTGDLKVTPDTVKGDIVLTAWANEVNGTDEKFPNNNANAAENKNLVTASVESVGTITARGNVDISATATNGAQYRAYLEDGVTVETGGKALDVWGQMVKTKADVRIDGEVTADKKVDITAHTGNYYLSAVSENIKDVNDIKYRFSEYQGDPLAYTKYIGNAFGALTANEAVAYAVLGGEATVTLSKDAVVTAKGAAQEGVNTLNISADSTVRTGVGASTAPVKFANVEGSSVVPSVAVTVAQIQNDANVVIDGKLASSGNANVSANASTSLGAAATDTTKKYAGASTQVNAAVVVGVGETNSSVIINNTVDSAGDLNIAATTSNSVNTSAIVSGSEDSIGATAVNVTVYDSSADVNVNSRVTGKNVALTAGNLTKKNEVKAKTGIGASAFDNKMAQFSLGKIAKDEVKKFISDLKGKIFDDDKVTKLSEAGNLVSVGASVAVADESNSAKVTLGKNAVVQAVSGTDANPAYGDVKILANNIIEDTFMYASGATNNNGEDSGNKALVNASVLYAEMDNSASVALEGGDANAHTQIRGKDVDVRANSDFQYNRVNRLIGALLTLCEQLKLDYTSKPEEYQQKVNDLAAKAGAYQAALAKDPEYANSVDGNEKALALALSAGALSADGYLPKRVKGIVSGPFSVPGMLQEFADPNNYANFRASSATDGKSDGGAKVAVAGSANINKLNHTAQVIVGKNSVIEGKTGAVNLDATVAQKDVALNGKVGLNSGGDTGVGGVLGLHWNNTNSLVAVAEGAQITAGGAARKTGESKYDDAALKIRALNDAAHTVITFGAGKAGDVGVQAMAGYIGGKSNSLVSIDDEAVLRAEDTGTNAGVINLSTLNDTVVTNVAGGLAMGMTAGVGASAAITSYDINSMAVVGDNDADAEDTYVNPEAKEEEREKDAASKMRGLVKDLAELPDGKAAADIFGSKGSKANGKITAREVHAAAQNDSVINTVTVAGGAVTGDDSSDPGLFDKLGAWGGNKLNKVTNTISDLDAFLMKKITGKLYFGDLAPENMQASNKTAGMSLPKFTVAGAGSLSLNIIDGSTAAVLDGAKIELTPEAGKQSALSVKAEDASFIGAWSGAAGISWKTLSEQANADNTSVGFGGAFGINVTDTQALAQIKDSTITDAGSIVNEAKKSGALVAAGLGLALAKSGDSGQGGKNIAIAGSSSVNDADNKVQALMEANNVSVSGNNIKTQITNSAYDNDTQVTGGLNMSLGLGGSGGAAVGATINYANVDNIVESKISGGNYSDVGVMDVQAVTDITQVGVAVGVGITAGGDDGASAAVEGVAVYNRLNNDVDAVIDGATINAEKVGVCAYDSDLGVKKHDKYIADRGLDATGASYIADVSDTVEGGVLTDPARSGNTIATGALSLAVNANDKGAGVGAAVAVNDIDNDFNAAIQNSRITATGTSDTSDTTADVIADAKSDTLLVGVAAGSAVNKDDGAGIAGSVTWQNLNNDVTASIEKSDITSASTAVKATAGTLAANVTGQVSVGKVAVGLALAQTSVANITGAYVKDSVITANTYATDASIGKKTLKEAKAAELEVAAQNAGQQYTVAAGVGVTKEKAAVNGVVTANIGHNNVEAIVDGSTLENMQAVDVHTLDNSTLLSAAGGVGAGKGAAIGGSVAYNAIGGVSGEADAKKQNNMAQINNTVITTANEGKIKVDAQDKSQLVTAAVGVGVSTGDTAVAVQGAAAAALANKKTEASMSAVDIASYNSGSAVKADVAVTAGSKASSVTTADVAAIAAGGDANAAVGAGVAVSRSEADTRALVSGGTQKVKNLNVQASSDVSIKTVGLGGSVGAGSTGVAVQGSVAVNLIDNDTAAQISGGANITADNNVGVVALSDESISNYAGTASVGAGNVGVSVGVSVSVNEINGGTTAAIGDDNDSQETKVTALGKGEGLTANTKIDDSEIHDTLIDSGTVGIASKIERGAETRKGVIVDASSTHDIKSFLVTAGVGAGTTGVGVAGTVNVNSIGGATSAAVEKAQLNGGASGAGDAGDVSVKAGDYTNSAGFVGTVSVGAGAVGVGVGMGSDTNLVKRSASAQITDSDIKAKALALDAVSRQGVSSLTVGAGVGSVGAGVAGVVTVTQLENSTQALINKTTVKAASAAVNADHLAMTHAGNVSLGGAGVGAGVGLSVGVLKDNSVTEAVVGDSLADSGDKKATVIDTVNNITINAQNHTKAAPAISATGVAGVGAGVAGATSVNNINSVVKATVNNARLTSNKGKIDVGAANKLTANAYLGANSAGIGGLGANVSVNTIDSTVQANVTNSILSAGSDVGVTAEEQRDITQLATNVSAAGAAIGANIAVTNVGKAISGDDENSKAVLNAVNQANSVYGTADLLSADYTFGALKQAGTNVAAPTVGAEVGGGKDSQITVNINNADITSGAGFKAEAKETDDIKMTLGSGIAGGAAVNAGVGILNVHRNVGVNMAAADVTAKTVAVGSTVTGGAKLDVYQGSAGLIGANAAYGGATTAGFSKINIAGGSLNGESIDILASDTGTADVKSLGVTVGAVALGAIVTEAENSSDVAVNVSGGQIVANSGAKKVSVQADKANSVTAHATGGIGGAADGYAVAATAEDNGNASVTVQNGSTLTARELTLQAANKPAVKAVADSVAVNLLGGVGTAVATAKAGGSANVTVQNDASFTGKTNSLLADTANINAVVGAQADKNTVEAKAEGNSGSLLVGVAANVAAATADMDAAIDISGAEYKTQSKEIVYKTTYDDKGNKTEHKRTVTTGATELNIKGENTSSAAADARGVTVGGTFTSGQNIATTVNASDIAIKMQGGGSDAALLQNLNITATGAAGNTTTADGSGGALVSGDLAASVDSSINSNIDVTVGGKLTVTGDVKVEALQKDYADLNADAVKATVVGGSATKAVNKIAGSNNITLKDADISSGGAVTVTADNVLTLGEEYQYAVKGSGYGGVNVQGAEYANTIDKSAAVKLQNARLTSNGAQTLAAQATGDITAGGYIKSAGLGAFTWVDVDNSVTTNNKVAVDGGSSMKTLNAEQDIILSASDSLNIEATAVADTQGAALGGASADLSNVLTRSNSVDVQGSLYSMHDVNLYAGQGKDGKEGKLNLELESEAYNRTALGFGKPKLANAMAQNNSVTVGGAADVSSVRHINLYADAGAETVRETNIMYNWYRSEDNQSYTSSIVGDKEPTNKKADNFVQLDGRLTAGIQNKQHITIGNTAGQLVFLDEDILKAVKNYGKGQESAIGGNELLNKQVAVSDGVDKDGLAVGTMDYGMELFKRYSELGELMSEYSEDKTSSAYLGYKAERERIMNEMDSLGLVDSVDGEKIPVEGMTIDYISLPDIVASGGNINIQTDTLSGSGQLAAQGSPEVTVTNNTNLYLKVNDVLVGEQGGEINYNNVSLTNDNYMAKIAELNRDKDTAVRFSSFEADASAGGSTINITGAYSGTKVHAEVEDGGQTVTVQLTPKADIEINGNVISEEGIVKITSAANNIVIQGADAGSSASVQGSEVYLEAAQGSVSQGYHDGITNIGGGVQELYKNEYETAKAAADQEFEGHKQNKTYEASVNRQRSYNGNMIAGGNIYINASDINVNGYIQSGYAKYELIIDADVQNIINQLQQNWQKQGSPALSDAVVTSGSAYLIVEGNRTKNRENTTYQVAAYYNPSTGMIVVPDVDAQGGKVYLTGRISSTGSGKINVLDGAYDISVTNNTGSDLQLGELASNDVEGLISITDTAKKQTTEIYRDKTVVTDLSNGKVTTSGESNAYNPQAGLRYNWTTGQQTSETRTYKHTHKAGLWGAVTTLDETKLSGYEATITPETKTDNRDKKNGEYIGKLEGLSDAMLAQDFVFKAEDILLSNTATTPEVRTWRSGFLGWFKWEELTWQRKTGSAQNYIGSVKADRPIEIGFFGNGDGHAAINVNSVGSVGLTGGVKTTANADSRISITTQGAINGLGGTLTGDNINLSADKGMSNIFVNSLGDTVNLNAVNSGSGDVDITVKAAYGRQGNVALESLNTNSGEVSLTAQGNIIQQGSGVSVSADRIDLTSKTGTIGTAAQAITVQGGQTVTDATDSLSASVNANARGGIYLTQNDGDLRLGRVYSDQGDVSITVKNGDLVDALPAGEAIDRGDTEALLQKWRDLGLTISSQDGGAGWDEKQLLYAIQDSIINPDSSATDNVVKDPNLKGKDITLDVKGSVGLNSDKDVVIDLNGLYDVDRLDDLKALTSADASSVTWDEKNKQAVINQKYPLGVQLASGGKLNVTAQDNVYLSGRTENNANADKNILNIELVQGGNIRLQSQNGIYNVRTDDSAAIIGKDLLIQAGKGSIGGVDAGADEAYMNVQLSGALQAQAGQNISLRQLGDSAMQITSMGAGKDINLLAAGNIVSVSDGEDAARGYIKSDNGVINISSEAGSVGTTEHALRIHNTDNATQLVNVTAEKGDVNLYGVSNSTAQDAPAAGSLNLGSVTAGGAVNIVVNGNAVVNGSVASTGSQNITLTAGKNIALDGDVTTDASVIMAAANDVLLNNGKLTAGSVYMPRREDGKIGSGAIVQQDTHSIITDKLYAAATQGVALTSSNNELQNVDLWNAGKGDISLTNNGAHDLNVIVEKKNDSNITITNNKRDGANSDVNVLSPLDASGSVSVTNNAGDVNLAQNDTVNTYYHGQQTVDKAAAAGGDITVTGAGAINSGNALDAGENINLQAVSGVAVNASANAQVGGVTANTATGDISFAGDVGAGTGITAVTTTGDISYNGTVSAGESVSAKADEGNISYNGTVNAGDSVIATTSKGDVVYGSMVSAGENVSVTTGTGNIKLDDAVNGGQGISLQTDSGSMEINSSVTAANGDISLVINNQGNIFDADDNKGSLRAINGNTTVTNNGLGDIDLDEIYALDNVRVELADGNLRLREINGKLVAVALRTDERTMDIERTVAATQILLNGSSLDLNEIEQRVDGNGMLVITPSGASDDKPIDTFSIGGIKTNSDSGIRFEHLWVNNADITMEDGKLSFDKLFVENKAEFTNKGMTTTIYGTPPVWNGSNSVYWHNTSVNRPEANLNSWLNDNGGDWVYLHFSEARGVQRSNAVLLHLQDHYYAYEQRFSGVGHLRYLQSDVSGAGYDLQQIPVSHYNRFDNYELPVFDDHAEAHELELHESSI